MKMGMRKVNVKIRVMGIARKQLHLICDEVDKQLWTSIRTTWRERTSFKTPRSRSEYTPPTSNRSQCEYNPNARTSSTQLYTFTVWGIRRRLFKGFNSFYRLVHSNPIPIHETYVLYFTPPTLSMPLIQSPISVYTSPTLSIHHPIANRFQFASHISKSETVPFPDSIHSVLVLEYNPRSSGFQITFFAFLFSVDPHSFFPRTF